MTWNYCVENLRFSPKMLNKKPATYFFPKFFFFFSSRKKRGGSYLQGQEMRTNCYYPRGVFSSKTFRRPLIAVGWGSAVWPGCIKDAWALSVGCATYLFFHYAQTLTRESLRCAREQNQKWRDEKDDGAEDVRSIFFPSAQLFLLGGRSGRLNREINQESQGRVWCGKLRDREVLRADS